MVPATEIYLLLLRHRAIVGQQYRGLSSLRGGMEEPSVSNTLLLSGLFCSSKERYINKKNPRTREQRVFTLLT